MRTFFVLLVAIHGLIHILGFVKGFRLADVHRLTRPVSRSEGAFWLLAALLFLGALVLFAQEGRGWWIVAAGAVLVSQSLIIQSWADAKYGTIANVIVLIPLSVAVLHALPSSPASVFEREVRLALRRPSGTSLLTLDDLQPLPAPVQKYLEYVGAVGKPKVHNVRAVFTGGIKTSMESAWMEFRSHQYNFFDDSARLFSIESRKAGIPFDGLHRYVGDSATMLIRVASLFPVVDAAGEEMNRSETVTMLNDMCVLAPATLIDSCIRWETIDALTARAIFTRRGRTISAVLSFNEKGELANFASDDRLQTADGKTYQSYRWSTPVGEYKDFGGRAVATFGEALWHLPSGDFPYGIFTLQEIEYNCTEFR